MSDDGDDQKPGYDVGYGRPPRHSRFKKGRSGNRQGRPKGSRNYRTVLEEIMKEKVSVVENGRALRLTKLEVLMRQLTNSAGKQNSASMKMVLNLLEDMADRHDRREAEGHEKRLRAQDEKLLQRFLITLPDEGMDDE